MERHGRIRARSTRCDEVEMVMFSLDADGPPDVDAVGLYQRRDGGMTGRQPEEFTP